MATIVRVSAFALMLAALPAQAGVRIVQVPEAVRLPAAPGQNLMLEVEVSGGTAKEVWLATDLASRDRVPLLASGERRFQLNLADPRVAAMLPAGRDGGELAVFAVVGGATAASAGIGWSRATPAGGSLRCLLRGKDGTAVIVESAASAWFDPAAVTRLELQGAARQAAAVAHLGELELPLTRREDVWVLEGGAALRERLQEVEAFQVESKQGSASTLFTFGVVPGRLRLRDGVLSVAVQQRDSTLVPGSNGWLRVHIDDITMGGTLLDVATADGRTLVPQQLVHERDAVEFALADERYVLVVDRLVNNLVREDYAEMRVESAAAYRPDRIAQLVGAVRESSDLFVREGKEWSGAEAAKLLVVKLASAAGRAATVEEFIDGLGSKSSKTGEPYHVRRVDGTTVTMQQWLRAALAAIEARERAAPPKK